MPWRQKTAWCKRLLWRTCPTPNSDQLVTFFLTDGLANDTAVEDGRQLVKRETGSGKPWKGGHFGRRFSRAGAAPQGSAMKGGGGCTRVAARYDGQRPAMSMALIRDND